MLHEDLKKRWSEPPYFRRPFQPYLGDRIEKLVRDGVLVPIDHDNPAGSSSSEKQSIRCGLLDLLAAHHEASHVLWNYVNEKPIHDVRINGKGFGGGEFRAIPHPAVQL